MFTENTSHIERELFDDILLGLPEKKRKKALSSVENAFYKEVFLEIDERSFKVLFENGIGRPNAPINSMVAALVLRHLRGWTYEELFEQIDFNLLTRLALGMTDIAETPFCAATLFNFQNRLVEYEREEKVNLFEIVFEKLTAKQMKRFGVRAGVQRSDSFQALTNVARYGRLKLMIEVLRRMTRILDETDKARLGKILEPYQRQTSEGYVYRVEDQKLPAELAAITKVYARLHEAVKDRYAVRKEYENFDRLFRELIEVTEKGPVLRRDKEINSGSLQSPDDPDATYNNKGGKRNVGHKVNVTETADPGNKVNLITDIAVDANNVGDGPMLAARMDMLKERTPELKEIHTDGAYGGEALDPKTKEHKVLHVETGSNAGKAKVPMKYERSEEGGYRVTCAGGQKVVSTKAVKRLKAVFEKKVCDECPFSPNCQTKNRKTARILYFKESWAKSSIRSRNILKIPEDRRKIRANVEATIKEFTGMYNHKGKIPLRGRSRIRLAVLSRAIAINFGRVRRHIVKSAEETANECKNALKTARIQIILSVLNHRRQSWITTKNFRQDRPLLIAI